MNAATPSQVTIVREPLGATDWGSLWLNEVGQIGFRAIISGSRAYVLLLPKSPGFEARYLAKEKALDVTSPYEFLYSLGQVAFLGTAKSLTGANLTTLWLWDGTALRVLAQNSQNGIQSVEFFPPDMNDRGMVVFRAFDSAGLRAVWVSDGLTLKRVATEHDLVPSDLGTARIDQETTSNPVFAGAPMINARGDISFVAGLAPPDNDQVEWGTAIYVARSSFPPPGQPDAGDLESHRMPAAPSLHPPTPRTPAVAARQPRPRRSGRGCSWAWRDT